MTTQLQTLTLLGLLVLCGISRAEEAKDDHFSGVNSFRYKGVEYRIHLTREIYREMKAWNIESTTPPPVTPQRAYKLAKARLDKFEALKEITWKLERVSLIPTTQKKYVWEVSFGIVRIGSGWTPTMDFLVTMDGKLIEPTVQ